MLVLALASVGMVSFAQKEKKEKKKREKDNVFWLDLSAGVGSTTSYDNSIVPYTFLGFQNHLTFGFTDEWKRCHLHFDVSRIKTRVPEFSGSISSYAPNLEFLYSCLKPSDSRWHFWSGASADALLELKQFPDLGNAAITTSVLGSVAAVEKVACDFAYSRKDLLCSFHVVQSKSKDKGRDPLFCTTLNFKSSTTKSTKTTAFR